MARRWPSVVCEQVARLRCNIGHHKVVVCDQNSIVSLLPSPTPFFDIHTIGMQGLWKASVIALDLWAQGDILIKPWTRIRELHILLTFGVQVSHRNLDPFLLQQPLCNIVEGHSVGGDIERETFILRWGALQIIFACLAFFAQPAYLIVETARKFVHFQHWLLNPVFRSWQQLVTQFLQERVSLGWIQHDIFQDILVHTKERGSQNGLEYFVQVFQSWQWLSDLFLVYWTDTALKYLAYLDHCNYHLFSCVVDGQGNLTLWAQICSCLHWHRPWFLLTWPTLYSHPWHDALFSLNISLCCWCTPPCTHLLWLMHYVNQTAWPKNLTNHTWFIWPSSEYSFHWFESCSTLTLGLCN